MARVSRKNVNVPRNDYEAPTEVRYDIVQKICDCLIERMGTENTIVLTGEYPSLFIGEVKQGYTRTQTLDMCNQYGRSLAYDYVRVHTVEMMEVFDILQDAGYFIYDKSPWEYHISKIPVRGNRHAQRVTFNTFID